MLHRFIHIVIIAPALFRCETCDSDVQCVEVEANIEVNQINETTAPLIKQSAAVTFDLPYVVFENRLNQTVECYWAHPGGGGVLQHTLEFGEANEISTFIGHVFYWTPVGSKGSQEVLLDTVEMHESMGFVHLYDTTTESGWAQRTEARWFQYQYFKKHGRRWSNYWPRDPVTHHYYEVAHIGEIIEATTDRSQFHQCKAGQLGAEDIQFLFSMLGRHLRDSIIENDTPDFENVHLLFQMENDRYYIGRTNDITYCREKVDPWGLTWDIINICDKGPHAFRIYDFLSDDEIEHIKSLGQHIGMVRSRVGEGDGEMDVDRTSQTVWLEREYSFIVDNIVRRIAHMIKVPQELLFLNASAEHLQLVHYFEGEKYNPHFDYVRNSAHSRYITFLMYLNEPEQGGYTSFPDAHESCKDENGYFGVQPIKGSAVFFYNLLPDGNVDERTMHYAEPPINSEKWMTNLWIWDEKYTR